MASKQIVIPYGHPAGERAYEILQKIAERLWEQAQTETDAFIAKNFRNAKTMREWIESEEYRREIKANRRVCVVSYNFRSKVVTLTEEKEVLKKCS